MKLSERLFLIAALILSINITFLSHALAYIDPSVSSYLIQAVAGIVVAVGAFFTIYWRRAKKKVQDKLGIDENARKEKESDVQLFDDAE